MKIESLKGNTYAFVDVETNGTSSTFGRIIEIAVIRVEDGEITDTFQTLVRPERGIPSFITDITGITNEELEHAPAFDEVALQIQELLSGAIFVAHNARFDYAFVKNEFKRISIPYNAKTLCTVKISRKLYPKESSHNLDSIIKRHKIKIKNRHRAYDDTLALIHFLQTTEKDLGKDAIVATLNHGLKNYNLPHQLDQSIFNTLPHAPGVYLLYDEEDTLLYVGKSIDIKNRVRSHFSGDHLSNKERIMMEATAKIDYEVTSGELSALLRESALVKELLPIHNRKLRKAKKVAIIQATVNTAGYRTADVSYISDISEIPKEDILGVFRTVKQGKDKLVEIQNEHRLCSKLLSLEQGGGPCFYYHIQKCDGACLTREPSKIYNERFNQAFEKTKIKSWPYKKAVVLPEDPEAEQGVAYVIDDWQIKKIIEYSNDNYTETDKNIDSPFDYDSYKILARHLLRPDIKKKIKLYSTNT